MIIDAKGLVFSDLNKLVKESADASITLNNVIGQRYIGSGVSGKHIDIYGVPGNALGAYLSESSITVHGNGQDAVGDTMNNGSIVIHGNIGDTTGYGMRGGIILVKGNAGYRVGIHMKEYNEHKPVIVVGGKTGDFLGEYQAGGVIIVLGIGFEDVCPVGNFCGTGMHGGRIYIRSRTLPKNLPAQVVSSVCSEEDKDEIRGYVNEYCKNFGGDADALLSADMFRLLPNTKNPYKQLYTHI